MAFEKKKKDKISTFDVFKDLKHKIKQENINNHTIPNILDFVEQKKYISDPPINLFPLQKLVLKCFYRGSLGNEKFELTQEDRDLINKHELNEEKNGNLIKKWEDGNQFRELVLIWGRRCLSGDSEIIDVKTGRLWTFQELWNYGKTEVESWTYDEKSKSMNVIPGCNIVQQGKRDVYQIKTVSGHTVEATDNHPFLTESGWKELKDLKPKEKIGLVAAVPFFGTSIELQEDEAAILGYLSSSCCDSVGNYLATTLEEGEVLEDFKSKLLTFTKNVKVEDAAKSTIKNSDRRKYSYIASQKSPSSDFASKVILFLQSNGIKNKTDIEKYVPARIFTSAKNVVSSYLKTIFSCNVSVSASRTTRYSAKIEASFTSYKLAKQIQHLLSRYGIFASLQEKMINGKPENIIVVSKNSHVKRFVNEIGLIGHNDFVQDVNQNVDSDKDFDSPIFSPIVHIRKCGNKQTYDLQVSDKEHLQNFVSEGFICHNSGKDFLVSIIALYEAMRLLETPGGNPYATYGLGMADPFTILCIANSSTQAKILFRQIKDKVLNSEYFKDKVLPEGVTADAIHFLTPEDKRRNKDLAEKGFPPNLGSIVVRAGHSNSDSLVGISCYVLLLDEIGIYKNTAGSSSGDAIYNSLAPAVATYVRRVPKFTKEGKPVIGPDGEQETETIYDGKIICLSTPRSKDGIFYNLYSSHATVSHRLICRAATWQVNPMQTKANLLSLYPDMPEEKFQMEYGAEFSGTAGENFFSEEKIEDCFREKGLALRNFGAPGVIYFAHLDPATSSHNYALVIAHKENFFNTETSQRDWRIVVDHIKTWSPSPGKPISLDEVDDYVIFINRRFHIGIVTYDHYNSASSIAKLRRFGIPSRMTAFTKQYKNAIYNNLNQIVIQGKLIIPFHNLLKNEMKNLQRKWLDSGYKVYPKKDGDVTTDDVVDALAGACYNCIEKDQNKYPKGKVVSGPESSITGGQVWRSMQGIPYGVGPGEQVARKLEQRASYPKR